MAIICGIDEAGRGPVIGPLVIAGVAIEEKDEQKLVNLAVKDSKLLSRAQRESLFDSIKSASSSSEIVVIKPAEIDNALSSGKLNLNWLEATHSASIINRLNPSKAFLDCPSNNIRAYSDYVRERIDTRTEIISAHKADALFPVVSAASILAKVVRDREIDSIKAAIGKDFGSGYPSDPATVAFLKQHYSEFPEIFRHSWASYRKIAQDKRQTRLTGYENFK